MILNTSKVKVGTILEGTIHSINGKILYQNRILFSKELKNKLLLEGIEEIEYLPIQKEFSKQTNNEKKEEELLEGLLHGYHSGIFSRDSIKKCLDSLKNLTFNFLTDYDRIDFKSSKHSILKIYEEIKNNPTALINLLDLKSHDDYTFCHSVNVAIIALSIAQKMGFSEEETLLIGMGGLLHDIGKIAVPASLINKTSVLSEEEKRIMRSHPSHSYRIMSMDKFLDRNIIKMAYEHHERYDGKGYPRGISGDQLNEYSVIVSLADVYDALTSVRSYKPAFSPEESIQVIEAYTGTHFSPKIAESFIQKLQSSIQWKSEIRKGILVMLNTNQIAQVLYYKMHPEGPEIVVQALTNPKGDAYKTPSILNLKIDKAISIKRVLKKDEVNWENLKIRTIKK